jgi:hypothetical protein
MTTFPPVVACVSGTPRSGLQGTGTAPLDGIATGPIGVPSLWIVVIDLDTADHPHPATESREVGQPVGRGPERSGYSALSRRGS